MGVLSSGRRRAAAFAAVGIVGMGGTAVALADVLQADGDSVQPGVRAVAIGGVCPTVPSTATAGVAIKRTGNSGSQVFNDGATVTVTTSSSSSSLSASGGSIVLPANWEASNNNTLSDTLASTVTVNAATAGSGSITYSATGTSSDGNGTTTLTAKLDVSWTMGICSSNVAPQVGDISGDATVDEGSSGTYSVAATDADADALTYAWSITSGSNATIDGATNGSSVDLDFGDGPASITLQVIVTDGAGGHSVTKSKTIEIENVAPTVTFTSAPASADEGTTKAYAYTVADPGSDTFTATPSCGIGGALVDGSASLSGSTGGFSCHFADGPASPVASISITDSDGGVSTPATQQVQVANLAPVLGDPTLTTTATAACLAGNTGTLAYSFSDAGLNDNPWSALTSDATSELTTQGAQSTSVTLVPGTNSRTVQITDKDGGASATKSDSLSLFFTSAGVEQPIDRDGSSTFKLGSTIPVKIKVADCLGEPVPTLAPRVSLTRTSGTTASVDEPVSSAAADTGNTMRWDSSGAQYIFNLSTKRSQFNGGADLTDGTYTLRITAAELAPISVSLRIKK